MTCSNVIILGQGVRVANKPKFTVAQFLKAIPKTGGIFKAISKKMKCSRSTVERYAEKHPEIREAISTGREPYGMIGFDQSLTELVQTGLITYGEAVKNATNADDFALRYRGIADGSQSEIELVPQGQFTDGQVPMEGMNIELDDGKDRRF